MKVLIIGSGAREHALAWKIAQSPLLTKLYAAPGNTGMAKLADCRPIEPEDIEGLCALAKQEEIDLTVVGPESSLVAGIVDRFQKEGLKIFGPSKAAAQLEGSKSFAKDMMTRYGVPTAPYEVFTNVNEAKHYVIETEMPVVIKADGLAAGKGVVICENSQQAVNALTQMMTDGIFGEAGKKVLVEKLLEGEEISILALCDGEQIIPLASAQDHKRAYDHDRGPNTGGMGAYSPCPQIPQDKIEEAVNRTIRPIVQGMAKEGIPYRGILYAGLMLTKDGPFVLEYNCRFGDPEAQVVLPRLKSDLLAVLAEIASGGLQTRELVWDERACLCVVLTSGGYPGHYHKGFQIEGLDTVSLKEGVAVFHAGTALNSEGKLVTNGGRVLSVSVLGENLRMAFDRAYKEITHIHFQDKHYRRDIGRRALEVYR